jgi:inner membrane protein
LVLLVMVALMMYLTRRIDWYAYVPTTVGPASTEPPVPPDAIPPAIMERS